MAERDNKKHSGDIKRRDVLKAITAVPAALIPLTPAAAEPRQAAKSTTAPAASGTYKPKVLNEHEWKTVNVLSDLIIPVDDRSGSATQAGVPEFIDDQLDFRRGDLLAEIRGGLTWLDIECNRLFGGDFIACNEMQQKQILDRIAYPRTAAPEDASAAAFFSLLRDLVVGGFFSSKMGIEDLPYLGNKMQAEWNGCPAEVLAKIEENIKAHNVDLNFSAQEESART